MDDFEKELKLGFLDEAMQLLSDAEQSFLELEQNPSEDVLHKIFRIAHNLKGSSRAVGFIEVGEFTHRFESAFLKLKNKEVPITSGIVTVLLACKDHLTHWIESLKVDLSTSVDSSHLTVELDKIIAGQVEAQNVTATTPTAAIHALHELSTPAVSEKLQTEIVEMTLSSLEAASGNESVPSSADPQFVDLIPASPPTTPKAPPPQKTAGSQSAEENIRVSSGKLGRLLNNVGELVIMQTVLHQQRSLVQSTLLQRTIEQLTKITKDIQDVSMSLRMVPLKPLFQKMQRIVRDISNTLNKDITLVLEGEESELDKTVVDQLGDPLVHLIRNAADHGLESPEDRAKVGKPLAGVVTLRAFHQGSQMILEVRDDGRGLDPQKIRAKAIEKGVIRADQVLTDPEAQALIFAPSFSTKDAVSELSGRGVGMDVVKTNIEKVLKGEVQLESTVGKGTCVRIVLPLTLAIIDGMVITLGNERYVIPLAQIHESIRPLEKDVHTIAGIGEVLNLRGQSVPLFRLAGALGRKPQKSLAPHESIAITTKTGNQTLSLLVDDIIGQQQVVIKPLGGEVHGLPGISGGAILGDGRAALILDINELLNRIVSPQKSINEKRGVA